MVRHDFLITITPLFLLGCASAGTRELVHGAGPDARSSVSSADTGIPEAAREIGREPAPSLAANELEVQPVAFDPALARAPEDAGGLHTNRFTIKGGYYGSTEDALDDGYILGVSWMRFLSKIFALELEVGYLDADGEDSGIETDVWALPLMVNGRLNLPVWVLDLYGGLGIGTFYYDVEASGALSDSDDGFLLGGNAFLGATFNLGDALALGLEGKYYVTDEISDVDTGLDAFALMLTLGFSR